MIKLGVLPVRSLLLMEDTLWAASGGQVSIVSVETLAVEVSRFKWPRRVGKTPSTSALTSQAWLRSTPRLQKAQAASCLRPLR